MFTRRLNIRVDFPVKTFNSEAQEVEKMIII